MGYDLVVTVTGVVLVFFILVILMAIISIEGKIFDGMAAKKKAAAEKQAAAAKPAAPAAPQAAPAPQPEVEEGIPDEVVAAIAAAVYSMGGGKYVLRSVSRGGRNAWRRAGAGDATAPF